MAETRAQAPASGLQVDVAPRAAGWLERVAEQDGLALPDAALVFLEAGLAPREWQEMTTRERAAVLGARRHLALRGRVQALDDAGQDLAAARVFGSIDDGRRFGKLLAKAAGAGMAEALRKKKAAMPRAKEPTGREPTDEEIEALTEEIDAGFDLAERRLGRGRV